ncbi:hypothetical protein OESDEN_12491 [Oesophagostomum dentatum]|uniref:Uncharacterized protein n=1 Tax=Oesophagostomum dentatum TaxID=61180 RepID=A0A0B1SR05_OESDE|nr:hypothetical protein OESDEN_12491 [Oesophagostomum dentatum]
MAKRSVDEFVDQAAINNVVAVQASTSKRRDAPHVDIQMLRSASTTGELSPSAEELPALAACTISEMFTDVSGCFDFQVCCSFFFLCVFI